MGNEIYRPRIADKLLAVMVLTAVGQFAYTRKDGVVVVPIGCLKP